MGAIGLNGAEARVSDPTQRSHAANIGWRRFSPILLGSVAAHLVSGSALVKEGKDRLKTQPGLARGSAIKAALTGAVLAGTAYQQVLGQRMAKGGDQPIAAATQPSSGTTPEQARAQRRLNVLQFLIPALTGSAWIVHSANGELGRPAEPAQGTAARLAGVVSGDRRPLALAAAAGAGVLALRRRRSGNAPHDTPIDKTPITETAASDPVSPGPVLMAPLPVREVNTAEAVLPQAAAHIDLDSESLPNVDRQV